MLNDIQKHILEVVAGMKDGQAEGAVVYHAGTLCEQNSFYTNGGRVLGVTALGDSLEEALSQAYAAVQTIRFEGAHYRTDIGKIK